MQAVVWYVKAHCMVYGCRDNKIGGHVDPPEMTMDEGIKLGGDHERLNPGHIVELTDIRIEVHHGGKQGSGRFAGKNALLDGVEWHQFPETPTSQNEGKIDG